MFQKRGKIIFTNLKKRKNLHEKQYVPSAHAYFILGPCSVAYQTEKKQQRKDFFQTCKSKENPENDIRHFYLTRLHHFLYGFLFFKLSAVCKSCLVPSILL